MRRHAEERGLICGLIRPLEISPLKMFNSCRRVCPPLRFLEPGIIAGSMPRARQTLGTSSRRIGPYSRVFDRTLKGGISLDGRTVEGKFSSQLRRALFAYLGCENQQPSVVQQLMVEQIVAVRVQLNALNAKMALHPESWTDHDRRALNALGNQLRLGLKALEPDNRPSARARRRKMSDQMREYVDPFTSIADLIADRKTGAS